MGPPIPPLGKILAAFWFGDSFRESHEGEDSESIEVTLAIEVALVSDNSGKNYSSIIIVESVSGNPLKNQIARNSIKATLAPPIPPLGRIIAAVFVRQVFSLILVLSKVTLAWWVFSYEVPGSLIE